MDLETTHLIGADPHSQQHPLIGVVGGLGPHASLYLVKRIHDLTKASKDQDHLNIALISTPSLVPDRTEFLEGKVAQNPADAIHRAILILEQIGATVAGIPCNTSHAYPIFSVITSRLQARKSKIRLINMVQEVAHYILEHHPKARNVGVIATRGCIRARTYDHFLSASGLRTIYPTESYIVQVHNAIYNEQWGIKAHCSPISRIALNLIHATMDHLIDANADVLVLGCTELPLAFSKTVYHGIPVVDSATVLARALILQVAPHKLISNPRTT